MGFKEQIKKFYLEHAPGATIEENLLKAPCPFCSSGETEKPAIMVACLSPESTFFGYFRCLNRCLPGGFPPYFARIMGLEPQKVPGYDPDQEPYIQDIIHPAKNLNALAKIIADFRFNRSSYTDQQPPILAKKSNTNKGYN